MEIKRQIIEYRGKDKKSPEGHLKGPAELRVRQERQETVGLRGAFPGEFPGRQPPHRGQGGRHHQQGGGDEGVAPVQRRVNPASQQASAQTAGHRGRDIRPHGHIQALQRQISGQVSRQAGSQGGHEQPLDESGPHQKGEAGGGGAKKTAGRHHRAAHQDEPLDRKPIRQHAEGQVGQGDSQDHRRDGVGGLGRVDPELLL